VWLSQAVIDNDVIWTCQFRQDFCGSFGIIFLFPTLVDLVDGSVMTFSPVDVVLKNGQTGKPSVLLTELVNNCLNTSCQINAYQREQTTVKPQKTVFDIVNCEAIWMFDIQ
jgi:hypothetical protein